jgi:hypothetical protein
VNENDGTWEVPLTPEPGPYLITREALDNFNSWVREAQQLRPILTDLIAELRLHAGFPSISGKAIALIANDAEARLREVTGDVPPSD